MLPKFVLLLNSFSGISQEESYPADGTDPPHAAHAAKKETEQFRRGGLWGLHSEDWQDVLGN
jgi:hypothetical protein